MKILLLAAMLSACTTQPSCDNPRNMSCMSAGQLESELACEVLGVSKVGLLRLGEVANGPRC
jgi:hypothetical protein